MTQANDGFTNLVSNLGGANAKTAGNAYALTPCSQQEVSFAYRTSTWFGKIVDIPADDATREWRSWKAEAEQIEALEGVEKRLGVQHKVNLALKWSRLYGGAVIIPDLPGATEQEYVPRGRTPLRFLHVLQRHQLTAQGRIRNPLSPYFGQPEYYEVPTETGVGLRFHPSRVILLNGRRSGDVTEGSTVWGDSIWQYLSDSVTSSDAGAAAVAALLQEAKVDIVRVESFMNSIANDQYEAQMQARWNLVASLKSISNVVLLDKEDEWDQKTFNWAGLPEAVRTLLEIMAGAADIPLTRLLGTSPGGLNSTGSGDLRNYYDSVKAKQDLSISPMLAPLDRLIQLAALGREDESIWYDWKPLWQPSEKERAETGKVLAETYAVELSTGAIDEEVLTKSYLTAKVELGLSPGLEAAILASGSEGLATAGVDVAEVEVVADAAPRTLYVSRRLLNTREFTQWARAQGFTDIEDDLHVTITYSRTPVDWFAMGEAWEGELTVRPGGPRLVEQFDGGAVVLRFASTELQWRNEAMRDRGASFDYPEYAPHVTITYADEPIDLSGIEAYQGELRFGPEVFQEINLGD